MMFLRSIKSIAVILTALWFGAGALAHAQDTLAEPLLTIDQLAYQGAFRMDAGEFGDSNLNFSQGPLAYDRNTNSIFIVGHAHEQSVAQFDVPDIVDSTVLSDLNLVETPSQDFVSVLGRAPGGNPDNLNRIGGLSLVNTSAGTVLLTNAYEYYDADGSASQTTLIIRDSNNLATSGVDGFYTFEGGAGHTSGWVSPVPSQWQSVVGGNYITGQSSGIPIISRTSVGPSAFAFDSEAFVTSNTTAPVSTTKLLDFSLGEPLNDDLSNDSGTNDLWTHLSRAVYGFIAPGTRTYVTLGQSGGHESGVCYKCTQSDNNTCGGYCPRDADDEYTYYWLWDMTDLVDVKNGDKVASSIRPYDYGKFPVPFGVDSLGGGSFDPASGQLFLTLQRADLEQGTYANPPVVAVYAIGDGALAPMPPTELTVE